MQEDFTDSFWTWYATDEFRLVLDACELMKALSFLQSPASVQAANIPDCPACETWSVMMLPVNSFLERCSVDITAPCSEALNTVWILSNELPESAFRCDDSNMFYAEEWSALRSAAAEALQCMGWETLRPHLDNVMLECHQALFPHRDASDA
ncbi:hypothetical protein CLU86_1546 [Acidovorax sp. 62]|uniref:hypothetical protein n=1 Tax=Acidovorax sp. 62 TaxID=2035203 RepID=UPI000C17CBD5|nr:hypothetical protein [Acidovorax sp. 62]PIF90657.1 hypothetical protein CLU86_1546 [Acidovorax sp. 62]